MKAYEITKYFIVESGNENDPCFQIIKQDMGRREIIESKIEMVTQEDSLRALLVHLGIPFEEMMSDDYIVELLDDLKEQREASDG